MGKFDHTSVKKEKYEHNSSPAEAIWKLYESVHGL